MIVERLIELCCATCEYYLPGADGQYICAYDGNWVTPDWFCRHWEEKEDENEL